MASHQKPALVLVHGGWHVPQHYVDFLQRLELAGYEVSCPLLPSCDETKRIGTGLSDDVKVIRDRISPLINSSRDIIMLLHSYGGAVGTEAVQGLSHNERADGGLAGGVVHIIYMCAFMLQVGESVASASLPRPDPDPVELDEATGTTFLCQPTIPLFYGDIEIEKARDAEKLLVRQSGKAQMDAITYPAWQFIPTTYLRTEQDAVLFPNWQDRQIKAVLESGTIIEVETFKAGHSPFLSIPDEMVAAVERVARQYRS